MPVVLNFTWFGFKTGEQLSLSFPGHRFKEGRLCAHTFLTMLIIQNEKEQVWSSECSNTLTGDSNDYSDCVGSFRCPLDVVFGAAFLDFVLCEPLTPALVADSRLAIVFNFRDGDHIGSFYPDSS